jgi:hypothetical protein
MNVANQRIATVSLFTFGWESTEIREVIWYIGLQIYYMTLQLCSLWTEIRSWRSTALQEC